MELSNNTHKNRRLSTVGARTEVPSEARVSAEWKKAAVMWTEKMHRGFQG